ncbi:glycerophosphodiester phosphodiesterase [Paenibacillus apiarius]|uniref:glycerophosphodiester phosphodiesterase n=1 Tax=Paenibacillus apiarius TaxID=46240 RepID=UPI00198044F9|nr:glycerophosphodiester phosphodiesterase [Paenibacillus apiarius]MBN3524603.1 glycerophosphodiester phosphodiesterase [Paenibacillus apiarius]
MNAMTQPKKKSRLFSFRTTRDILQVWKHAHRPFLLFELAYKLMTVGLFIPLLSVVFNKMLDLGGFNAAANHDLLRFVFSRYGLLSLILMAPVAMMLIYTEFAVLIYIAYYGMQGKKARIRAVLLKALSRLPGLWRIGIFGLSLYLLLLVPLLDAGFGPSLLPNVTIPNFITGELLKTGFGTVMFLLFFLIVLVLNCLCIYALPILVLENTNRFWYAVWKSSRLFWKSKWSIVRAVLEWVLVFALAVIVFLLVLTALLWLLPEDTGIPPAAVTTLGVIISIGVYALTLVMTPLFITLITRLYVKYSGKDAISIETDGLSATVWESRETRRGFIQSHRPKLATFGLLVLIAIGWGVSALLTDVGEAKDEFIIMAHRGDVQSGVENTLGAFAGAIEARADYIELDILQTKDHKLAVIHDENLKRLSGENVNVFDLTLNELQKIPLRQGGFEGHVSSLDEVLEFAKGRIRLNIELKTHGHEYNYVPLFVDTVRRHKAENDIVVQSLEYDLIQQVKAAAPDLKVGYVIYATFAQLSRFEADFFVVEEAFARPRLAASAKLAGKPLYVWTVNDPEQVEHFYTLGVDGIITDISADARDTIELLNEPILTSDHKQ